MHNISVVVLYVNGGVITVLYTVLVLYL